MTWRVTLADGTKVDVTAESVYVNPVGALLFLKKAAAAIAPPSDDPPKKKAKGWPKKAATVGVRGYNGSAWIAYELVEE